MDEAHNGKEKREELMATDGTKSFDDGIIPYSEKEADKLSLKLANKESFTEAKKILNVWFKRDICKKNFIKLVTLNLFCFHNMVKWRDEQMKAVAVKGTLKDENPDIQSDIERIEDVIKAIENPDIFDSNSSAAQKKKIQAVKNNFLDLKKMFLLQSSGSVREKVDSSNSTMVADETNELIVRKMTDGLRLDAAHEEISEVETKHEEKILRG